MFKNRQEAAEKLVEKLAHYQDVDGVVLGLPRGGVVLAEIIAKKLNLPLDLIVAKKINPPGSSEYAIGAVAEGGGVIVNPEYKSLLSSGYLEKEIEEKRKKIRGYLSEFSLDQKRIDLNQKIVILVDDGIATGYTMLAAIDSVKKKNPQKVIVATPVIPSDKVEKFKEKVDELCYIGAPSDFMAIGQFYDYFSQVENKEVKRILENFKEN